VKECWKGRNLEPRHLLDLMTKDIKNFHWRPCGKFQQIGPPRISPRGGMPLDWHRFGKETVGKPFGKLVEDVATLKKFLGCLS
jgi:hypothetical protein